MKVPLSWLANYVDLELPVDDLAHQLTMSGLKVEAIERVGEDWHGIVIGQVVEIEPHPTSRNPLWVTKTDLGDRTETIVTGAQNVREGDKVPVAPVGVTIPSGRDGEAMLIESRPMAGITSRGMLASAHELGISDEHSGIFILPHDAPVGAALRSYMGDDVLEIETNPNRPDTLSIIGIAREVAAITQQQLTFPDLDDPGERVEYVLDPSIEVQVDRPDLSPRYSALRIEGVHRGETPFLMRRRLELAGMRSISLLVDITNYVMLEYGQPMHAFDERDLKGGRIVVRTAAEGETIVTLDGVKRALTPQDLVIADAERAVGIAGVMGGENSEVADDTTTIILESANFDPVSVRRTAKRLDLRTEASSRFEKSLPPEQTMLGLNRYVQLLAQWGGGALRVWQPSDVWVGEPEPRSVRMPVRDLHRLLGIEIAPERAAEALSLLGFDVLMEDDALRVPVPFWRRADIALSADVVEEVARIVGFDAIPATLPQHTVAPPAPLPDLHWEEIARQALLGFGVSELVTHSLTSRESTMRLLAAEGSSSTGRGEEGLTRTLLNPAGVYAHEALIEPVSLLNPPSRERTQLRMALVPSLVDEVARNLRHTQERVAFFEIARTYFRRPAELPYERRTLAIALSGYHRPVSWQDSEPRSYSFFDVKGMIEGILDALHVRDWRVERGSNPALHPGRSAVFCLGGEPVGYLGELHPLVAAAFDIEDHSVVVAELDLDSIFSHASDSHLFHPIPRFPPARRDIAALVDESLPAADVLGVVRRAGGDLLDSATIFDVYAGPPLPPSQKSVAIALEFRSPGATLTQEEVNEQMSRIVNALSRELNAALRE